MNKNIKQEALYFSIFCPFIILHGWGGIAGIISAISFTVLYCYLLKKPALWSITKIVVFQGTFIILYYISKVFPDWSILCNVLSIIVFGAVLVAFIGKQKAL